MYVVWVDDNQPPFEFWDYEDAVEFSESMGIPVENIGYTIF